MNISQLSAVRTAPDPASQLYIQQMLQDCPPDQRPNMELSFLVTTITYHYHQRTASELRSLAGKQEFLRQHLTPDEYALYLTLQVEGNNH